MALFSKLRTIVVMAQCRVKVVLVISSAAQLNLDFTNVICDSRYTRDCSCVRPIMPSLACFAASIGARRVPVAWFAVGLPHEQLGMTGSSRHSDGPGTFSVTSQPRCGNVYCPEVWRGRWSLIEGRAHWVERQWLRPSLKPAPKLSGAYDYLPPPRIRLVPGLYRQGSQGREPPPLASGSDEKSPRDGR